MDWFVLLESYFLTLQALYFFLNFERLSYSKRWSRTKAVIVFANSNSYLINLDSFMETLSSSGFSDQYAMARIIISFSKSYLTLLVISHSDNMATRISLYAIPCSFPFLSTYFSVISYIWWYFFQIVFTHHWLLWFLTIFRILIQCQPIYQPILTNSFLPSLLRWFWSIVYYLHLSTKTY